MRISKFILYIFLITFLGSCSSGNIKKTSPVADNTAYDFTLPDQNGKLIKLGDVLKKYRGAVIAFYPKDDTKK
jgi:hypothetical protein